MIALLQRVTQANVTVDHEILGQIGKGLLILLCAERGDTEKEADQLLEKLLNYRVFSDENGKMNLSVTATGGGMLIVPQFTLAADTRSGTCPAFCPGPFPVTCPGICPVICPLDCAPAACCDACLRKNMSLVAFVWLPDCLVTCLPDCLVA